MRKRGKEQRGKENDAGADTSPNVSYYDRRGARLPEVMTVAEVARLLMVDPTTVRRWIDEDILEVVTLPHRSTRRAYRIHLSTMVDILHLTEGEIVDLLTVATLSKELRVDETTVRRWIKNRILEAVSLPHAGKREIYRVKRQTLKKLLVTTSEERSKGELAMT